MLGSQPGHGTAQCCGPSLAPRRPHGAVAPELVPVLASTLEHLRTAVWPESSPEMAPQCCGPSLAPRWPHIAVAPELVPALASALEHLRRQRTAGGDGHHRHGPLVVIAVSEVTCNDASRVNTAAHTDTHARSTYAHTINVTAIQCLS